MGGCSEGFDAFISYFKYITRVRTTVPSNKPVCPEESLMTNNAGAFNTHTSYQQWVWKREAYINGFMVIYQLKAASVWNYLEVYWPCPGGLSAVNAIIGGMHLRGRINSGLTRWRMAV